MKKLILFCLLLPFLSTCSFSAPGKIVLTGKSYPSHNQPVKVFFEKPSNIKYEEIGIVSATGSTFILWTDLIETMQKKAASVGGNAIIIIMREKDSEASAFYHPKMGFIGGSSTQKNLTGIVIRIID